MPSSFGFDKLVSINKSLVFTILSELNTEESVSCCGIRRLFGLDIGSHLLHVSYFELHISPFI